MRSEDDSDQDADYKSQEKDINSLDLDALDSLKIIPIESDEDIAQVEEAFKLRKRKHVKSRDIGWKKNEICQKQKK